MEGQISLSSVEKVGTSVSFQIPVFHENGWDFDFDEFEEDRNEIPFSVSMFLEKLH